MLSSLKDLIYSLNDLVLGKEKKDRRIDEEVIEEELEDIDE